MVFLVLVVSAFADVDALYDKIARVGDIAKHRDDVGVAHDDIVSTGADRVVGSDRTAGARRALGLHFLLDLVGGARREDRGLYTCAPAPGARARHRMV